MPPRNAARRAGESDTLRSVPLLERAGLLAAIVESSDDAIVSKDLDGIITSWNRAAERMFGYTADEMIGTSVLRIIPDDRVDEEAFVLGRVRSGKGVDHFETRRRRKDGSELDVSLTVSPVRNERDQIVGASKIARDVTEDRRLRRSLEEANRAKDEFLAMLGHELRNPLAPILTALRLMEIRGVGGTRECAIIERQVRHMVSLVDDLLDVSRITRGALQLHRRPFVLAESVAEAIDAASPLLEQRRQHLTVDVPRNDDHIIEADPARITQVLTNLLTNASKYTPEGGHISVASWVSGRTVGIRVSDDGVGIAQEALSRIFDIFAQERPATGQRPPGLGIGLAIVRNLVQLHGGTVTAHSDGPGRGSTFEVLLPRRSLVVVEPSPEHVRTRPEAAVPKRVLVVDDNADNALLLAETLGAWGHETRMASDGAEALAIAVDFAPEVVLLDIGLPGMDGYELGRELRDLDGFDAVRLIAVSGYGQANDLDRSRGARFEAHLVKPVDPDVVLDLIAADPTGDEAG